MSQKLNILKHQQPAQMLFKTPKHTKTNREKTHIKVTASIQIGRFNEEFSKLHVELKIKFSKYDNMINCFGH